MLFGCGEGEMDQRSEQTSVQKAAEELSVTGILVQRWFGAWVDLLALAVIVAGP